MSVVPAFACPAVYRAPRPSRCVPAVDICAGLYRPTTPSDVALRHQLRHSASRDTAAESDASVHCIGIIAHPDESVRSWPLAAVVNVDVDVN